MFAIIRKFVSLLLCGLVWTAFIIVAIVFAGLAVFMLYTAFQFLPGALSFPLGTLQLSCRILVMIALFAGTAGMVALLLPGVKALGRSSEAVARPTGKRLRFLLICAGCFAFFMFVAFLLSGVTGSVARKKVKSFLSDLSTDTTVTIAGNRVSQYTEIVAEIQKVKQLPKYPSYIETRIPVKISTGDTEMTLILGRDSVNKRKYWILYPYYPLRPAVPPIQIGGIITDVFAEY
jgi:hypothetical protein